MALRLILFLLLNFGALAIGSLLMNNGPSSDWYLQLSKAPWTPPGWVFGAAWTSIMICFAVYMSYLWEMVSKRSALLVMFSIQWILNVSWNPVFFRFHQISLGFIIISLLTLLVAYFLFNFRAQLKAKSLLILPYLVWLLIATSLNGYILLRN